MEKLFYSISEAAEAIGESVSLVRFWSNSFESFIKPHRNGKGNRMYSAADIETLKQIHLLVKEKGMTLEGAASVMQGNRSKVQRGVKAIDSLKEIRAQLVEIKKSL